MNLKILHKKTMDLSNDDRRQIIELFFDVFQTSKDLNWFDNILINTPNGYAYHTIMYDNESIVGSYTVIPFNYIFFGKNTTFGLSVDTMIKKEYRGKPKFNVITMANKTYDWIKSEKVSFVFGFPNENIYLIRKKRLKWVDVGSLNYYIFPINTSNIIDFGYFNWVVKCLSNLLVFYNWICMKLTLLRKIKTKENEIYKISGDLFDRYRYDNFIGQYKKINTQIGYFTYTLSNINEINIAFVIDFYPQSNKLLELACDNLLKIHKSEVDAILYIGSLEFNPINMFKIPRYFEPKKVYMSGKILTSDVDDRVFELKNWAVNLSNYDVV